MPLCGVKVKLKFSAQSRDIEAPPHDPGTKRTSRNPEALDSFSTKR